MRDANMQGLKLPRTLTRFPTLSVGLLLVGVIFISSFLKGDFGAIGRDSDDVLRLVQIRDFLGLSNGEGQKWFDTTQYRLGLAGGTDMHWSRIPDIPLLILTAIFDLFTDTETALRWAYSVWPPLTSLLLVFAMAKGAQFWSRGSQSTSDASELRKNYTYIFTLVLLSFFVFRFFRFTPGAIDHHNIQIGLIALAMAFALDPKSRLSTFAVSGFATAISLAVGVEVYIFAAIICGFIALNWLVRGREVAIGTQGFGFGLAGGLALAFFGTISPAEYSVVACDALSLITLSAGSIGGIGLALAARVAPQENFKARVMALSVVGVACLLVLARQAPECLANPLNTLPDEVDRLWLDQIEEAKPISLFMKDAIIEIPFMLGAPFVALAILSCQFWKTRAWSSHVLTLMLLLGAVALTIYQQRFYPFAYIFALLPLAGTVSELYRRGSAAVKVYEGQGNGPSNIAYIAMLALSIPLMWVIPGSLVPTKAGASSSKEVVSGDCYSADVMTALNTLPVGLISVTSGGGARILKSTEHRALSGNYHRNMMGIAAQIEIATAEPAEAVNILRRHQVDYVHFCYPSGETYLMIRENPEGLYGKLKSGVIPKGLVKAVPDIRGGAVVSIYRVTE